MNYGVAKAGDIIKVTFNGAHFFGFVLEVITVTSPTGEDVRRATVWRPELTPKQAIQTWPLDSHYQIDVVNEI